MESVVGVVSWESVVAGTLVVSLLVAVFLMLREKLVSGERGVDHHSMKTQEPSTQTQQPGDVS